MKKIFLNIFLIVICVFVSCCGKSENNQTENNAGDGISSIEHATANTENKKLEQKNTKEEQNTHLPNRSRKITAKPKKDKMVRVIEYIPDIKVDLRYSTKNNFTGQKIYNFNEAYLRYGTVAKLKKVQDTLKKNNYSLLIWDAYRPVKAQYHLWEICPDSRYVANPYNGYSSHSRGNTVDVTICYMSGEKVKMPTDFDDFSEKADRDYTDCSPEKRSNAKKLEDIMEKEGFKPYFGEWWHFSDADEYSVKDSLKNLHYNFL